MAKDQLIVALAKVLIAAAWADGELDTEEVNIMKDLLFHLPHRQEESKLAYTAVEWSEIEMYIDSPVPPAERERLIADLKQAVEDPEDKAMVLEVLDDLVRADGVISPEDEAVVAEIRHAINEIDYSFFGQLSRLWKGSKNRRSQALADAPNREKYLDDFIHNKVYYGVRMRLDMGEGVYLPFDETKLRQLSAVGGLLARVAQVDTKVTDNEFDKIVGSLEDIWELTHEEAVFVAEVAISEISPNMDTLRLVREIYSSVNPEQVPAFLDLLFAVGAADGYVSNEEIDVIYELSRSLGQPHKRFIEAKLRIPAEQRES